MTARTKMQLGFLVSYISDATATLAHITAELAEATHERALADKLRQQLTSAWQTAQVLKEELTKRTL